jgi:hypothetical protein
VFSGFQRDTLAPLLSYCVYITTPPCTAKEWCPISAMMISILIYQSAQEAIYAQVADNPLPFLYAPRRQVVFIRKSKNTLYTFLPTYRIVE